MRRAGHVLQPPGQRRSCKSTNVPDARFNILSTPDSYPSSCVFFALTIIIILLTTQTLMPAPPSATSFPHTFSSILGRTRASFARSTISPRFRLITRPTPLPLLAKPTYFLSSVTSGEFGATSQADLSLLSTRSHASW
ncbi:hypothetical protein HGRIS_009909 [Hohenbuehelia grisea]|uniref:Uncharacterized protein n=1 Tax=Hohenbuehelia grisea TaxID=104357 RepID=A0ABR3J2J7_9AGAR